MSKMALNTKRTVPMVPARFRYTPVSLIRWLCSASFPWMSTFLCFASIIPALKLLISATAIVTGWIVQCGVRSKPGVVLRHVILLISPF